MRSLFKSLIADEQGITAIEYGILATLEALATIPAATNLGTAISGRLTTIATTLGTIGTAPPTE